MRRGHPGLGGWRSENPRHFRPRCGEIPHFRPPRKYSLLETPRFPPPEARSHRGPHSYNTHSRHVNSRGPRDHHERNQYRDDNLQNNPRAQDRGHHSQPRHIQPYMKNIVQSSSQLVDHNNSYREPSNFYDDIQIDQCHVNSMGDVDFRQSNNTPHNQDLYGHKQHQTLPWAKPPSLLEIRHHFYDDRSPPKSYRHHESNEGNKMPILEYGGHRPPSSDHYVGNADPIVNNNNSFSRSVDDTVDIVRRRLMNRNEPQQSTEDPRIDQSNDDQEAKESSSHQIQDEPPAKKRIQRQKHNAKSNCDKMKSKIVHQLFKMDKDKMHKLMDNPSSSTKFEYAISSLITESQNSLNRHLRSVAEKSLYSSSTDFIHNDNNTIYEDTFMKQMQCLLDPQDTVLLEDIKPLVMAELSKMLQLDEFEQKQDGFDNQGTHHTRDDQPNYSYYDEPYNYEGYVPQQLYNQDHDSVSNYENVIDISTPEDTHNHEFDQQIDYPESKPLYERRPVKTTNEHNSEKRKSMDIERQRRSCDTPADDKFNNCEEPRSLPFFDANAEQLSEDDDPFAGLDQQYHVAVDHNFIENDDIPTIKKEISNNVESSNDILNSIKEEIDSQIQSIAKSPLKLFSTSNKNENVKQLNISSDKETVQSPDFAKENNTPSGHSSNNDYRLEQTNQKYEHAAQSKDTDQVINKSDTTYSVLKSSTPSNIRKRSIDQRPSHRKEKRKKSESSPNDTNKHIANKTTHINNNLAAKSVNEQDPCHEASKAIVNFFFSKEETDKEVLKDNKKAEGNNKGYSDKYVKRKDTSKRGKESGTSNKKRTSSSSSHSNVSPKENNNTTSHSYKTDPKTKLKTFDMFMEQPKKMSLHQSHRNTAPAIVTVKTEENKTKEQAQTLTVTSRKTVARHVGVQVYKKMQTRTTQTIVNKCVSTRFSQTERKKLMSKLVQTDPISLNKTITKSNDAFERMKQIDLEIQVLLQEKFKLYSSLESRDSCPSSMPALGMTVLNVTTYDENKESDEVDTDNVMSADAIVDEFTNIPVEELEQIALESVQEETEISKVGKRGVVKKLQQDRKSSESPTSTRRINKKAKPPNISLLEQIITDDRPLEDIISLDDLEKPPVKSKRRLSKSQPKKKPTKKAKPVKIVRDNPFGLKECSVKLIRADLSNYFNQPSQECLEIVKEEVPCPSELNATISETNVAQEVVPKVEHVVIEPSEMVEHADVNDLQFDMLDVSEDIVIGDSCEMKFSEEKDHERVTISEEIILDNSQSSLDNAFTDPGQVENECKTYDYSTDENLRRDSVTVTGHADAVLAIECVENDFIAACLDGNVYHFSGDGQLLNTLRGSNLAVTCLTIVKEKYETVVYTGSLDSRIRYYDLDTGLEKGPECNVLSPIQTMDRAWDTIFVGTRTGFVLQFECKNNMLIPVSTVKFSEQSILALRAMKEGPRKVLLVAARSENVTIKDAQTGLLLRTLVGPKMTVYTLLFEDGKVYCGTSSNQIHVFDYASGSHTACHEGGKGAVCLRASGGLLFAGCYDGCVYVYREGERGPRAQLRGPSLMLLSLAIVGTKIIAGYKDRSLYIWKIPLNILQEMIL